MGGLIDRLVGLRVDEPEPGLALHSLLACVEDAGRDGGLVALADEARHVGLYHHVLLGHGLALQVAVAHILRMRQAHEAPGGQALRQGELQADDTVLVGRQLRVEECCLVEVLAQLHLLGSGLAAVSLGALCRRRLGIHHLLGYHHFVHGGRLFRHIAAYGLHHHAGSHRRISGQHPPIAVATDIDMSEHRIDTLVETAELKTAHACQRQALAGREGQ